MSKKDQIFFDYNATTPIRESAKQAMLEAMEKPYNPSSVHSLGREGKALLNKAREEIAKSFGAEGQTIIFTASGTESNLHALNALNVDRVLVSATEHVSILKPAQSLGAELIPVNKDGLIDPVLLHNRLNELGSRTLVSIIYANNETGVIQDIKEIAKVVFENNGFLHVDASQAAGKIPLDFSGCGADLMTISSHKLGGPVGAAALIVKNGLEIKPLFTGGGQEKNLRAGTENLAAIAGFAAASKEAVENINRYQNTTRKIQNYIEDQLKKINKNSIIFAENGSRLSNTTCFAIPELESETNLISLDLEGICVSSGSACSSGRVSASHVITAMGYDEKLAKCAIRVSTGWQNTIEEAQKFISIMEKIIERKGLKNVA
jgi:cysteine desulfurase